MLVAAAQLHSSPDAAHNLARGRKAIAEAAERGAGLVVLPELFMAWGSDMSSPGVSRSLSQPIDGDFVRGLQEQAKASGVWVICGTLETPDDPSERRASNTTVVIDDSGTLITSYRKVHLYDAFGTIESEFIIPGKELFEPIPTPFGCLGLFVCYEIRYPEIARQQVTRGATALIVPTAWVEGPMKEWHWRHLLIARAIENAAYVISAGQVGNGFIGRSLIVDPMGVVLAEGSETESMLYAEINPCRIEEIRQRIPSWRPLP
jgi:predicted amidohydrolase